MLKEYFTKRTGMSAPTKPAPVPTPPAVKPGLFRPVKRVEIVRNLTIKVSDARYLELEAAAKTFDVSIEDFIIQAIDYALQHTA